MTAPREQKMWGGRFERGPDASFYEFERSWSFDRRMLPQELALDRAWVLKTWDQLVIPKPFSRVLLRFGKLIPVPADATDEDLANYQQQLQDSLDRVCQFAEANVNKVGSPEFPYNEADHSGR